MKVKAKRTGKRAAGVTQGSGNVFADLRISRPEQELLKASLTLRIFTILKGCGISTAEVARILDKRHSQASPLSRNRAGNFSIKQLTEFLAALSRRVEITVLLHWQP